MSSIRFGRGSFYQFFRREDIRLHWDMHSAVQFLNRFRSDSVAMDSFRRQVLTKGTNASASKLPDEEVIQSLARMMARGEVLVALPNRERRPDTLNAEQPEAKSEAPKETKTKEAVADEPTFESNHDGVAQADVLRAAAATGIPFCEECERAAALQGAGR